MKACTEKEKPKNARALQLINLDGAVRNAPSGFVNFRQVDEKFSSRLDFRKEIWSRKRLGSALKNRRVAEYILRVKR